MFVEYKDEYIIQYKKEGFNDTRVTNKNVWISCEVAYAF